VHYNENRCSSSSESPQSDDVLWAFGSPALPAADSFIVSPPCPGPTSRSASVCEHSKLETIGELPAVPSHKGSLQVFLHIPDQAIHLKPMIQGVSEKYFSATSQHRSPLHCQRCFRDTLYLQVPTSKSIHPSTIITTILLLILITRKCRRRLSRPAPPSSCQCLATRGSHRGFQNLCPTENLFLRW